MSLSLVKLEGNVTDNAYSIHPLVHAWIRDRMSPDVQRVRCHTARALMTHSITWRFRAVDYTFRRNLIPHITSCGLYTSRLGQPKMRVEKECVNFGLVYYENGFLKDAEELQVSVMKFRENVLGGEHPDTFKSMAILASTFWAQGRDTEAKELESRAAESRRKRQGQERESWASARSDNSERYHKRW